MKKQNKLGKMTLAFVLASILMVVTACGKPSAEVSSVEVASTEVASTEVATPETQVAEQQKEPVYILYTNDVHGYIDNDSSEEGGLSYAYLAGLKEELGENTLVVDAGDHIQGSIYGAMDQGESVLEMMDEVYDVATMGNHEFDYGIDRALSVVSHSKYPYISCNFVQKETGEPVVEPYVMREVGDVKIGFVGISTPETFRSTSITYFEDENGNLIYDFLDGEKLYGAVQNSVDALEADGADYVIAVGHLGVDEASELTSRDVISHVEGLDVFIDGHSHTEMEKELVKDKDGEEVILTQTGNYFNSIGKLTIEEDGITTELIKAYDKPDEEVTKQKNEWVQKVDEMLEQKIGVLDTAFLADDSEGNRLVRVKATSIGEFIADGYYYYMNQIAGVDCDVAIINGGGIRAGIDAGEVSYKSLKMVNPFGNMLCAVELTGQQILDMLEWGSRSTMGVAGEHEEGAFLQTAGLTYVVDTSVVSTVQQNDQEQWNGAPTGAYRVKDVKIYDKTTKTYEDIDLTKTYCVAGANYILVNRGDGFEMVGGEVIQNYIVEDDIALSEYVMAFTDVDKDGLADIASDNSPLCAYAGYEMDYEKAEGANRSDVR